MAPRFEELLAPTRVRCAAASATPRRARHPLTASAPPALLLRPRSFLQDRALAVAPDCPLPAAGAPPGAPPRAAGSLGGGALALASGASLPYDWLVLAPGASVRAPEGVPGAAAHALPFATLEDVARVRDALAAAGPAARAAVVGAGVGGCELAATLAARLVPAGGDVTLLAAGDDVLPGAPPAQRDAVRAALAAVGVRVLPRSRVRAVAPLADGTAVPLQLRLGEDGGADAPAAAITADVVLWAAGATPGAAGALAASLGADDAAGALPTDDTLRLRGHERIFALGDGAAVGGAGGKAAASPRLAMTAQVAFQAADYCAWNVWAAAAGRPLLPFRYQHLGDMLALGPRAAAVALPLGGVTLDGPAAALLRRAAYVYRMPTDAQRARVGVAWLQQEAAAAWEALTRR